MAVRTGKKPRTRRFSEAVQAYLECRVTGHLWDRDVGGLLLELPPSRERYGRRRVQRCQRCGTVRWRTISTINGFVLAQNYIYPEGYALAPYDGHLTLAQELRWELIQRDMARENERISK